VRPSSFGVARHERTAAVLRARGEGNRRRSKRAERDRRLRAVRSVLKGRRAAAPDPD